MVVNNLLKTLVLEYNFLFICQNMIIIYVIIIIIINLSHAFSLLQLWHIQKTCLCVSITCTFAMEIISLESFMTNPFRHDCSVSKA